MLATNNIKPVILILCTGNSCRSQMAEGILRAAAGDIVAVCSAGSKPAGYVHPLAIQVMAEVGIDITGQTSKSLSEFLRQRIETVITICPEAEKGCPVFPGEVARLHWPFDDPAQAVGTEQEQMAVFRRVRDQMRTAFENFAMQRRTACSAE
jgi:arsenate reductase